MSQLANEQNAINMSQGFPEFGISQRLVSLVESHMYGGDNQYANTNGVPELRKQISKKYKQNNIDLDWQNEITVTSGATEALFAAITAVVEKGDEVIIIEPAYDSYRPAIELNGGTIVPYRLSGPEYQVNWKELAGLINTKTKALIINSPNNPTSKSFGKNDFNELESLVKKHGIYVISDEVYEHINFKNEGHVSVLDYEELRKKSFSVYSFGKTFHATGWKVGYAIAPPEMTQEFRKIHQYLTFSTHTPTQYAIAEYMEDTATYLELSDFYLAKKDLFLKNLQGSKFKVIPCEGTYFQLLDYSGISNEKDFAFAKKLTIENKIASIPLSPFYSSEVDSKILRFCFAKKDKTLEKAANILCQI